VNWIYLAQDMDRFLAVVDRIITFGSLKMGEFPDQGNIHVPEDSAAHNKREGPIRRVILVENVQDCS
jgi:hypothetical protein